MSKKYVFKSSEATYKHIYLEKTMYFAVAFIAREHSISLKEAARCLLFMGVKEYCKTGLATAYEERKARMGNRAPSDPKTTAAFIRNIKQMLFPNAPPDDTPKEPPQSP